MKFKQLVEYLIVDVDEWDEGGFLQYVPKDDLVIQVISDYDNESWKTGWSFQLCKDDERHDEVYLCVGLEEERQSPTMSSNTKCVDDIELPVRIYKRVE